MTVLKRQSRAKESGCQRPAGNREGELTYAKKKNSGGDKKCSDCAADSIHVVCILKIRNFIGYNSLLRTECVLPPKSVRLKH